MAHEVYRVVARITLNRVEQFVMGTARAEKIISTQTTESLGEGQTPAQACAEAFGNGIQSYIEGLPHVMVPGPDEKALVE